MALYRTTTVIGEDVKNGSCTQMLKEVSNILCDPVVRWGNTLLCKSVDKATYYATPTTPHDQCI